MTRFIMAIGTAISLAACAGFLDWTWKHPRGLGETELRQAKTECENFAEQNYSPMHFYGTPRHGYVAEAGGTDFFTDFGDSAAGMNIRVPVGRSAENIGMHRSDRIQSRLYRDDEIGSTYDHFERRNENFQFCMLNKGWYPE